MSRNLLNSKFNNQTALNSGWFDCSKIILLTVALSFNGQLFSQINMALNLGTYFNKLEISSDNLNITNKTNTKVTISPLVGLHWQKDRNIFGFEFKFFKINYNNEFKYMDKLQNNVIISSFMSRIIELSFYSKQQLFSRSKSSLNLTTMLNIAYNDTPFDEITRIFGPNTYDFYSQKRNGIGFFYSLSAGLEYNYAITKKYKVFIGSQLNSNFNRTLVEENNTIAYPNQTIAYQFLKVNGKSIGVTFGITCNLTKNKIKNDK